jgi:LPS-assembly protein
VVRLISLKSSFKPDEPGIKSHGQRRLPLPVLFGDIKPLHPVAKAHRICSRNLRTAVYLLITIMVLPASHPHLWSQQVTTQATPLSDPQQSSSSLPDEPGASRYQGEAQNSGATQYPVAEVLPATDDTTDVKTEEDTLSRNGSVVTLDGDVVLTYRDRIVKADHIEFDQASGDVTATGHLHVSGGANHEDLTASHGTMNLKQQTATFYDVTGSVGLKSGGHTLTYSSSNPFLFTGRMVVRTGPQSYEIYDGTLTTCQLPHPDWMLYAGKFAVDSEKAKAQNSTFRLMNIPVLFLPYVTHPTDSEQRQTGFMIPVPGYSSTKGFTLGEEFYWAINRSTDLTVGAQYYSLRGWEQSATFRYRGLGNDFVKARYTGLLDRGIFTSGVYLNQGGEDATVSGRHDFTSQTRVVGDVEYLSSYAYREAFAENFSVAVSSDILSIVYGVHQWDGYSASARVDRYQGLKQAGVAATPTTPAIPEEQVKIFHAPSLDFSSTEHEIGRTGLVWSIDASHAGLSRVQKQAGPLRADRSARRASEFAEPVRC